MSNSFRKQVNYHVITWSKTEKRYVIKNPKGKRIYDTEYLNDAKSWIKRNTK